jgi:hypothetical protein
VLSVIFTYGRSNYLDTGYQQFEELLGVKKFLIKCSFTSIVTAIAESRPLLELLYEIIKATAMLQHGGLLVISNRAEQEAKRLGGQAVRVKPFPLRVENVPRLTAIDGAVLIDSSGVPRGGDYSGWAGGKNRRSFQRFTIQLRTAIHSNGTKKAG